MGGLNRKTQLLVPLVIALALLMVIYPPSPLFFNSPSGNIGVGFIIVYEDGSVKVYEGTERTSLDVVEIVTGKSIRQISCVVKVTPTWVGTRSSNQVTGTVTIKNDGVTKYSESPSNPTLVSGSQSQVYSRTISNAELNSWSPATGGHKIDVSASITVTIIFIGGTSSTQSGSATGSVSYWQTGGALSIVSLNTGSSQLV